MSTGYARAEGRLARVPDHFRETAQLGLAHMVSDIYFPILIALQPVLVTTPG